ncbi:MAG: septum formation initiator family protein [Gammaproteobacteria bacterium]
MISLKQGADALEERARVDLGMIREGETLIQLIPADSN